MKAGITTKIPTYKFCSHCFCYLTNAGTYYEVYLSGAQHLYDFCSIECFLSFSHDRGLKWEENEVDKELAEQLDFSMVLDDSELPTDETPAEPKKCKCSLDELGEPLVDGKCSKCGGV